jgi:transposase
VEKKQTRAAERDRPDVAAARAEWRARQAGLDPAKLVFIDETWVTTNMARRYGWGPTAERVVGAVPHGHWKTTTFVAALRADGLSAPTAIDGAITGELFRAYVEQVLAPTLRRGDVVVMDNLQCHKVAGVAEAVRRAKARVVYLPAYSPDLNPIEQAFSKLKAELRRREERTVDRLWDALGQSLDWFTPAECGNYFRHAGYKAARRT